MSSRRSYAKRVLVHYFEHIYEKTDTKPSNWNDCKEEIEAAVDAMIDAAVLECRKSIEDAASNKIVAERLKSDRKK